MAHLTIDFDRLQIGGDQIADVQIPSQPVEGHGEGKADEARVAAKEPGAVSIVEFCCVDGGVVFVIVAVLALDPEDGLIFAVKFNLQTLLDANDWRQVAAHLKRKNTSH